MASRSGTAAFSSTLSVVAPCPDGVLVAMVVASVDGAIPRVLLLVLPDLVVLALQPVREASVAVEDLVGEVLAAIVVEASVGIEASAGADLEAAVVVIEVMEAVVAVSAISRTAMAPLTVLRPDPAAVLAVAVVAGLIEAAVVVTETIDEDTAAVVVIEDQVVRTTNHWVAEIELATVEIATVGMAAAVTTTAPGNVGMRVIAMTIRDSDRGGTKLRQQLSTLIWVCQKVTFPSSALFV
jgi:hypothetical protein